MRAGEEAQQKRRIEFICRFVPEGVRSGHDLLYDFFDKKSDFVPTAEQLNECLDSYHDLLAEVPPDSPEELREMCMMEASELTLSYLARWRTGKEVTLDRARVEVLLKAAKTRLATVLERYGEQGPLADGYKRVCGIVELLDECSA